MAGIPLINGVQYSWGNIKIVLFGTTVSGITEIEYTSKQKKENLYGGGTEPTGRGYGNKEYEASITLYREELNALIAAAPGRDLLQIPPFPIQIVYESLTGAVVSVSLKSCEFTEHGLKAAQGDTSLKMKLPLIVGQIVE
jgi:hypothetical protein